MNKLIIIIAAVAVLFAVSGTSTFAANANSRIDNVQLTASNDFLVTFADGVSCTVGFTALTTNDNPHLGAAMRTSNYFMGMFFNGYTVQQYDTAPMSCN